jgi:predicted MPP superfamily phosphohydrolase
VMVFNMFMVFAGLLSTYVTWRLSSGTGSRRIWRFGLWLGIFGVLMTTPCMIVLRRAGVENAWIDGIAWPGSLGFGFLSFLFAFLVLCDLVRMPVALLKRMGVLPAKGPDQKASGRSLEDPGRRLFLVNGMNCGMMAGSFVLTGYGVSQAQRIPQIKEVSIPVAGLPDDLKGFRIVQITDMHIGPSLGRSFVEGVVQAVNGVKPHVIALTGDLADGTVEQLADDVAPLRNLESSYGKFFVTGNHEYYSGVLEWVEKVKSLGFTVLLNEHKVICSGRGRLLLAGVTDYRGGQFIPSHAQNPKKALEGCPATDVKILLAHQPKSIFEAAAVGYDLQISGHTHGGQFFPWNLFVGFFQPYVSGLHTHEKTQIYVSQGTGYWGPPVRVGSPSEITLIQLTSLSEGQEEARI